MNHFNEKGFSLREEIITDTFNFTITVNVMPENNNTRITCRAPKRACAQLCTAANT